MAVTGRVIEQQKRAYLVETPRGILRAAIRTRIRKDMTVYPGDMVDIALPGRDSSEAVIEKRHERISFLVRPPVANMELVVAVATMVEPPLDLDSLDRLLFCAEVNQIDAAIVYNKSDLLPREQREKVRRLLAGYSTIGYPVYLVSAVSGEHIAEIVRLCHGRLSCLAGRSGVGKSTILSRIFPEVQFKTSELSAEGTRGIHTTTTTTLLRLPRGGYIADSPGFSAIETPRVPPEEVCYYFPELESRIGACRFATCVHDGEPGCRIKELIEKGDILQSRYDSYIRLYREMQRRKHRRYRGKR